MYRKILFPVVVALLLVAGSTLFGAASRAATQHRSKKKTAVHKGTRAKRTRAVVRPQHRTTRRRHYRGRRRRYRGQRAPTAQRITEIQQALAKTGNFTGTPDGKWGPTTVEAMKKFQAANGLNATGKLDAHSLQKLGLGSQIAGLAPPLPPSGSTSLADQSTEAARQ